MGRRIQRKKDRTIERKKEQDQFFMPEELIIEILLRLPVKSLLRFKSVCKVWYALITSSDFVNTHFDHHTNRSSLLVYHGVDTPSFSSTFSTYTDEPLSGETPLRRVLDYMYMNDYYVDVIGPVSGLFCIFRDYRGPHLYDAIIVNPATRECKPLVFPYSSDHKHWFYYHMFGFGIDVMTGDYKVVSTFFRDVSDDDGELDGDLRTSVYSLASDSWTYHDIDPIFTQHRPSKYEPESIYINGSCYWLLYDNNNNVWLHAFDFTSEVLRKIKGPKYDNTSLTRDFRLVLHNDSLSIFIHQPLDPRNITSQNIDVIVMKEEGYWTKDISIDVSHLQISCDPLGYWRNSNILLLKGFNKGGDSQLIMYDPSTYQVKELGCMYACSTFIYKESLISVKGENMDHIIQYFLDLKPKQSHNETKRARMEFKMHCMSSSQRNRWERRKVKKCSKTHQINNNNSSSTFFHMLSSVRR